jgi:lysophospholipase L1-like esterase
MNKKNVNRYLSCRLCFILLILSYGPSHSQNLSSDVKRILFIGNSITYQGNYVNAVEAYFLTHFPGKKYEIINVGLPSETVSGLSEPGHAGGAFPRPDLHERLHRVLAQIKPDLVFASYGMNDGIYLPLDADRFKHFKDGINWLHEEVVKTGARIIHLTPPVYDELTGKSTGYAAVLDRYTDWLLSLRSSLKWEVIDVHYPMKKYLEAHRKVDSKFALNGFALASDGVHPGETGHWIMAKQILLYLGCEQAAKSHGIAEDVSQFPNGLEILKLVTERQMIMRDAWLTATGYIRPGLNDGLPIAEAQLKSQEIERKIHTLTDNQKLPNAQSAAAEK